MKALIFTLLMSLQPHSADKEDAEHRAARMHIVAQAITEASEGDAEMALALVTVGLYESRFSQHVHEHRCKKDECDGGKAGTIWQIQYGSWLPKKEWKKMLGTSKAATVLAAKQAAKFLRYGKKRCGTIRGAFSNYATGHKCYWRGSERRYATYLKLTRGIGKLASRK